jgi:hypothetical protein
MLKLATMVLLALRILCKGGICWGAWVMLAIHGDGTELQLKYSCQQGVEEVRGFRGSDATG